MHSDATGDRADPRRLAFILHLSRGRWDAVADGGAFVWCANPFRVQPATFNTLTLFGVSDLTPHFVSPVWSRRRGVGAGEPAGRERRLAVSGWFLSTDLDEWADHDHRFRDRNAPWRSQRAGEATPHDPAAGQSEGRHSHHQGEF